jgi:hypothetical protein
MKAFILFLKRECHIKVGIFYILVGVTASLGLFLLYYLNLRMGSNLDMFIQHIGYSTTYLAVYVFLTLGSIIIFGINTALLAYRWRRFGSPLVLKYSGSGLGALLGIVASSCPVCGITILSLLGITGGLSAIPFNGLELRFISLILMAVPLLFMVKELQKPNCNPTNCPVPRDDVLSHRDRPLVWGTILGLILLTIVSWQLLKSDPLLAQKGEVKGISKSANSCTKN